MPLLKGKSTFDDEPVRQKFIPLRYSHSACPWLVILRDVGDKYAS